MTRYDAFCLLPMAQKGVMTLSSVIFNSFLDRNLAYRKNENDVITCHAAMEGVL